MTTVSENRIVSVDGGSAASYAYDQQNRRYKKTLGSTVTHYVWEGSQVLSEHNGSTGAVLIDYVYPGSRMIAKVASGSTQYFLSDRLSVRLSLDSSGNVADRQGHLPFGEDLGESGNQEKHHFTSYERDSESGTDYAVNRQYLEAIGRFMRADPYSGSFNLNDAQSPNRYSYSHNDPVNAFDPDGRVTQCSIIGTGTIWKSFGGDGWALIGSFTISRCSDSGPWRSDTARSGGGGGRISCNECCGLAWDLCWDMLLQELAIITPGPRKAAAKCVKKCL